MSCRAELLTGTKGDVKLLAVPVQALRYEDNPDKSASAEKSLASVFIYDGGRRSSAPSPPAPPTTATSQSSPD